jgi:hypothetical protein
MRPLPRWRIWGRKASVTARAPNRLTFQLRLGLPGGTASTGPRTRIPAVAPPMPPESPVTRIRRTTGGGAGQAGTDLAWVVMGAAPRDRWQQPG